MKKIILASGSPRRKELLEQVGIIFSVITSDADENIELTGPEDYVCRLATIKANAVKDYVENNNINNHNDNNEDSNKNNNKYNMDGYDTADTIIIGADTIVWQDGVILTKPKDKEDARRILKRLSNNSHQVYTGVAILCGDKKETFFEKTDVMVHEMTDKEIDNYIATGEPMDKAGAYGIQGAFARYVDGIHGDYNNVVGLPVAHLCRVLKNWEE